MRPDTDSIIRRRIDTVRHSQPKAVRSVEGMPTTEMVLALAGSSWWRTISPNTRQILVDVTSDILSRLRTPDSEDAILPFGEGTDNPSQTLVRIWMTDRFGDRFDVLCTGSYLSCEDITLRLPCRLNLAPGSGIRMDILPTADSRDFIPVDGTISRVAPSPDGFPDAHQIEVTFRRLPARN